MFRNFFSVTIPTSRTWFKNVKSPSSAKNLKVTLITDLNRKSDDHFLTSCSVIRSLFLLDRKGEECKKIAQMFAHKLRDHPNSFSHGYEGIIITWRERM